MFQIPFKDEKFDGGIRDDDQKGEFKTKHNSLNFEPITTNISQRIELDVTEFPISLVYHHDLTSPKVQEPMKLSTEIDNKTRWS
jgi:hypothetical protein